MNIFRRLYEPEYLLRDSQRTKHPLPSTKELYGRVFKIAWPSLTESFLLAVISMVDTIMVSALGTYAISAVGLTTQPRMIVISMFAAMGVGVTAVCARRLGQRNQESAQKCLRQCLLIEFLASLVICTVMWFITKPLLLFAGAQPDTIGPATDYYRIILLGMPANIITITINAAQRGVGNTKVTMRTNIIANVVNVIFNYLLIEGNLGFPRLEVAGAAIATSLGYTVAMVVAIISVLKPDCYVHINLKKSFLPDRETMQSVFKVSSSACLEQIFLRVGFFLFAKIVATLGTVDFATHQIGLNVLHISFSFGDGLAVAASALIGRSLGERRPDMAVIYGKACQRLGLIFSGFIILVCLTLRRPIVMIFTNDPVILEKGGNILLFVAVITMMQISAAILSGALRSAGDTLYVSFMSMLAIGIMRPTLSWFLCNYLDLGLYGAWMGIASDQVLRLVMLYTRFSRGKWTKIEV